MLAGRSPVVEICGIDYPHLMELYPRLHPRERSSLMRMYLGLRNYSVKVVSMSLISEPELVIP